MRGIRAAIVFVAVAGVTVAADWPQFLGPERNGVYRGPALAETWPAKGPQLIVRLNGTLTAQAEDAKFTSGPIALQYAAGTVRFRRVQIRKL